MSFVNSIFNTTNLLDKVVYKVNSSRSVARATFLADSTTITIPHNLGYAPLCIGQFSESSSFSTAYEFGNPPYWYDPVFAAWGPRVDGIVESDSTNIYVTLIAYDAAKTLYYRVLALIPPDITDSPVMPVEQRNPRLFDTTLNYLKIDQDDTTTVSLDGINAQTITIPHNLGYNPMALVFSEESGRVRRVSAENSIGVSGLINTAYVTTSNLVISADCLFAASVKFYYRIYLDD